MSGGTTLLLGAGSRAGWTAVILLALAALCLLALAAVTAGFNLSRRSPAKLPALWLACAACLGAAGYCAYEASLRFTRVGRIDVDAAGAWTLRAQTGRIVGRLAPETGRALVLWAEARTYKTSPYGDDLHGLVRGRDGREHRLRPSVAFDLLARLGYGNFWLDHRHMGDAEEARARAARARLVYAGPTRGKALALPLHSFDARGLAAARAFLAARARAPL